MPERQTPLHQVECLRPGRLTRRGNRPQAWQASYGQGTGLRREGSRHALEARSYRSCQSFVERADGILDAGSVDGSKGEQTSAPGSLQLLLSRPLTDERGERAEGTSLWESRACLARWGTTRADRLGSEGLWTGAALVEFTRAAVMGALLGVRLETDRWTKRVW